MRFKFVDELLMFKILNLILAGISENNFKNHVASDIGVDQKYIAAENFLSQSYLDTIEQWIYYKLMKLNQLLCFSTLHITFQFKECRRLPARSF